MSRLRQREISLSTMIMSSTVGRSSLLSLRALTVIMTDAVKNPNASLESIVDDWIESYKNDAGPAMAELVNFAFRVSDTSYPVY